MTAEKNIVPHGHIISMHDRRELLAQNSKIIWFTGLSGSGKSTIAGRVEEMLNERGFLTYLLDGDNIRTGLNKNLGFNDEDRNENIRRIGEVSKLFIDAGVIVLTAFISPFKADRQLVRDLVAKGDFIEIFINCPLEICELRDPKGLYKKARAGEIKDFTGISSPFEIPHRAEIEIRSDQMGVEQAAEKIVKLIKPKIELD
ncbi:MAG: adenylyl-sulfate kinase [Bacteroidetes bacterium]|nr:adenylyl-sulfate kinase [Bacteroidota bacterium]